MAHSDRQRLYHMICSVIQHRYTTQSSGLSLLHLSLIGSIKTEKYNFNRLYTCVFLCYECFFPLKRYNLFTLQLSIFVYCSITFTM